MSEVSREAREDTEKEKEEAPGPAGPAGLAGGGGGRSQVGNQLALLEIIISSFIIKRDYNIIISHPGPRLLYHNLRGLSQVGVW